MKKKNILMIALSLCLIAVIAVSGTLAYFTDTTDASTNTFTMGQVKIDLTESTTDSSSATSGSGGIEYVNVMPGDTRSKIVTVTKDTDSADCYVAVLVQAVPDSSKGIPETDDLLKLVNDKVLTGWTVRYLDTARTALLADAADEDENGIPDDAVYALYTYNEIMTDTEASATLFNEITFPAEEWGNSYATASFDLKISAYAVQSDNFPTGTNVADWFASSLTTIENDNQTTTEP